MESLLEEISAVNGYIDNLTNGQYSIDLKNKCGILLGGVSEIEWDLERYIASTEDDEYFTYVDKSIDQYGISEVVEIVKKSFYEAHCHEITDSNDEYIFNRCGEMLEPLTYFQSKEIVEDYPLAIFLMSKENSSKLLEEVEIVKSLLEIEPELLKHCGPNIKKNRDIILCAVDNNGRALEYASVELKNDKAVVMKAVSENGFALQHASKELKNDKAIVLQAVREDGNSIRYASEDLQNLVGNSNPVATLTKAIASENLSIKLHSQLKPKVESQKQSMRVKI